MKKLTVKETSFAAKIIEGLEPSAAYRASKYKSDVMSPNVIAVQAQKLLNKPHISLTIENGKKAQINKAILTRDEALEILTIDAREKTLDPPDRHRAIKHVVDMQGWNAAKEYDFKSTDGTMSPTRQLSDEEIKEQMEARGLKVGFDD